MVSNNVVSWDIRCSLCLADRARRFLTFLLSDQLNQCVKSGVCFGINRPEVLGREEMVLRFVRPGERIL